MSVAGLTSTPSTLRWPSATSVLPSEQSAQVIAYMLRPSLTINQYIQWISKTEIRYMWLNLSRDDQIRVVNTDEMVWADGQSRKDRGKDKGMRWSAQTGEMIRRDESVHVPWVANEQIHSWDLMQTEVQNVASRMQTAQAKLIWDKISNTNWGLNSRAANDLNGGRGPWTTASSDPNSGNYNAIEQTLLNAVQYIELMTNGAVTEENLVLVVSPADAIKIANAPEIRHILNFNQVASIHNQGFVAGQKYGFPLSLYGIPVVVERSMIVTSRPKASGVEATADVDRTWIMPSGSAYLLSRPGSLIGAPGAPSFSTVQCYHYGSLLDVEVFPDVEDRLTRAHCSQYTDVQLPALIAGMKITNIIA